MKYITLKMTEAQFRATCEIVDNMSAMLGEGSDFTDYNQKRVNLFDRMLKKNGYKRNFN